MTILESTYREWLAHPLDRTPRMMYADRLEDLGLESHTTVVRDLWSPNIEMPWEAWMSMEDRRYWHPDQGVEFPHPTAEDACTLMPVVEILLTTPAKLSSYVNRVERTREFWLEVRQGIRGSVFIREEELMTRRIHDTMAWLLQEIFKNYWPGVLPMSSYWHSGLRPPFGVNPR